MNGMSLEIWIPRQGEVTVVLESTFPDQDDEQRFETSLFAHYVARQLATTLKNKGVLYFTLADALITLDEDDPLADVEDQLSGVRVASPSTRGGRKGFTAELRPEKDGAFFELYAHGFRLLGKGVAYYVPTSTLALLAWLLRCRVDNRDYQKALALTARNVGVAASREMLNMSSEAKIAMDCAGAAWFETTEGEGRETRGGLTISHEAARAAQEHNIDFPALVIHTRGTLKAKLNERAPDSVPNQLVDRICEIEVLRAAGLVGVDGPVDRAFNAAQTAQREGHKAKLNAASFEYARAGREVLEDHGLLPVVAELHTRLFTRD
jgi:hypothetical protein